VNVTFDFPTHATLVSASDTVGSRPMSEMGQTLTTLFALLAIVANVAVLGFIVIAVAARVSEGGARLRDTVWDRVGDIAIPLGALVALTASLGSLYYSEVQNLIPCTLCWYQRIAMYPLPLILGIAAWRRDRAVWHYVLPIALIGAAIAGYHYQLEWFPEQGSGACSLVTPCNVIPFARKFGFITLAYMALSGFLLIAALSWIAKQTAHAED
jgi:disulfide bond formation protein DsbB